MKRVKCYGRMKTACVDTVAKKEFFGDPVAKDSFWDSGLENQNVIIPEKVPTPSEKKEVNYGVPNTSPQIFSPLSDSCCVLDTHENNENQAPVKPKIKSKKVKNKKTIKKKTVQLKTDPSVNIKEPRWSIIDNHSLYVERGTFGNKRRNVFPNGKPSKPSCLTSNIQNQPTRGRQPNSNEFGPNFDIPCERVISPSDITENQTGIKINHVNTNVENEPTCHIKLPNSNKLICNEDVFCKINGESSGLIERFIPLISYTKDQCTVSLQSNSADCVAEISCNGLVDNIQTEILVDPDLEEKRTPEIRTNAGNQSNGSCSIFDSADEMYLNVCKNRNGKREICNNFVQNSTPLLKAKKYNDIARLPNFSSPNVSCIPQFNFTQKQRFESTNRMSFSKNMKIITSTPTVSSNKRCLQNMPLLNLSQIRNREKDSHSPMKKISSFSKSSVCFQSRLHNKNSLVTLIPNKTRSLNVLHDSSKLSQNKSQFSSSCQIQPASKSKKSYSCMEKIFPEQLSSKSYTNIDQSLSAVEKLIELCGQEEIKPFATAYDWSLITVQKIGEGTYGEVFTLSLKKKSSVIKIIPISQDSTSTWLNVETVYSEVKVSQCLSNLRNNKCNKTTNFNKLNSVHFVKGSYPLKLITAWDTFSTVKTSYNTRPDCFDKDQLYVILELEYGGKDMTSFVMKNATEAESILKQVALSLAIAEETHLFEHRDLHLGNILVQRVKKKSISYILRGKAFSIQSQGLMVTIIDFTLSRVLDSGCVYYNNLADDESLFNQSGDYQFEIYRATREHLKNEWHQCSLYSNVLWLTFLCAKMKEYRYKCPTSIRHKKSFNAISVFQNDLKSCKSAFDCLKLCKILSSIPQRDRSLESKLGGKTVFLDRKSLQKSKLSIRN